MMHWDLIYLRKGNIDFPSSSNRVTGPHQSAPLKSSFFYFSFLRLAAPSAPNAIYDNDVWLMTVCLLCFRFRYALVKKGGIRAALKSGALEREIGRDDDDTHSSAMFKRSEQVSFLRKSICIISAASLFVQTIKRSFYTKEEADMFFFFLVGHAVPLHLVKMKIILPCFFPFRRGAEHKRF